MTHQQIATYFSKKFDRWLARTTLSDILKNSEKILADFNHQI